MPGLKARTIVDTAVATFLVPPIEYHHQFAADRKSDPDRSVLTDVELFLPADTSKSRSACHCEVGQQLRVAERSIANYLSRIYEKLNISSRAELVLYAPASRQG